MIFFHTAGESHGKALVITVDGMPAGMQIDAAYINSELRRRQHGYGRGKRMQIETDTVEIFSGIRHGRTLGSPIAMMVKNKDFEKWQTSMSPEEVSEDVPRVTVPRPGHADLAGLQKYGFDDIRNVIERSSARETCARVAAGALCKLFLREFNIRIFSYTRQIGTVETQQDIQEYDEDIIAKIERSPLRTPEQETEGEMIALIDHAEEKGTTLGGSFCVVAAGVPPGLGSYVHWDEKLDGDIARAIMSIHSVKGVEIGAATRSAGLFGSDVHDPIIRTEDGGITRKSNNAGGIEGGVTNGMPVVITAIVKPISTQKKGLQTIDLASGNEVTARYERSDVTVIPAAGVVGEAMLAYVLAAAFINKFGGDSLADIKNNAAQYMNRIKEL